MLNLIKSLIIITFFLLAYSNAGAQSHIVTHSGIPASALIQDSLISGCVTASNVTTNGSSAFGAFTNANSGFPFLSGLIMATGDIANAEGPDDNTSEGSTVGTGSDPDLAMLTSQTVYDATIIEFDFVPASDTVRFDYIFGSEEFPEFANSGFSDVFGFFISGPGINGPYTNNAKNIALLPNGQAVTIDNVFNSGTWYTGSLTGSGGDGMAYSNLVQYDGCTLELTAEAIVQACQTYHIKLAIGDAGDSSYDSGVFIESGSFTSGVEISAVSHSDVGTNADLYEGCDNYFVLERSPNSPIDQPVTINIDYLPVSTAIEGVDISPIDSIAYLPPYDMDDTIAYTAYNDGIEEGTETMVLEFWTACPCGGSGGNSIVDTIYIYDAEGIKGGIQNVQTLYCGETPPSTIDLVSDVNISPSFYEWSTGSTDSVISVSPQPGTQTYNLTISDVCGNEVYDSVTIKVSDMNISDIQVDTVSCHNSCDGRIEMTVENNYPPFNYYYANADYFYLDDSVTETLNPVFNNLCAQDYYVKVEDSIGCYIETDVTVPGRPSVQLSAGIINNPQTSYCEIPDSLTLIAESNISNPSFTWWNGDSGSEIKFIPELGENEYWVEISDPCGNIYTDNMTFKVSDIDINSIVTPDEDTTCSGIISVTAEGGISPYNYYWLQPLNYTGSFANDLCIGDYIVEVGDDNGCRFKDTITVPGANAINNDDVYPVSIYPNPAKSVAYVDLSSIPGNDISIEIFDITGKLIIKESVFSDIYKTPVLKTGSYTIKIDIPQLNRKYVEKLVITE